MVRNVRYVSLEWSQSSPTMHFAHWVTRRHWSELCTSLWPRRTSWKTGRNNTCTWLILAARINSLTNPQHYSSSIIANITTAPQASMHHYYPCSRTRSNPVAPLLSTHSIWLIHSPIASFIRSSSPYSFAQCQCVGLESADASLVRVAADQSHVFSGCYLARQRVPRSTLSSHFHWSLVAGEEFISCTGVHSLVVYVCFIIARLIDDESGSFSKGWLMIVTQELHPCLH